MKTWEMIKELIENPDKKFKTLTNDDSESYVTTENSIAIWRGADNYGQPLCVAVGKADCYEWEEVKEPVSFMEALNNGNRIRPESWRSEHYLDIDDLLYEISDMDEEEIRQLLNGEWYTE
jgi:hypothetical protein